MLFIFNFSLKTDLVLYNIGYSIALKRRMKEKEFIRLAIEQTSKGVKCGDGEPFNVVIIREHKIISKVHNTNNDSIAHVEINAIRIASQHLNNFNLS